MTYKFLIISSILFTIVLSSCSSSVRFTSEKNNHSSKNNNTEESTQNIEEFEDAEVLETTIGTASFYADKFHGRLTSNGETYDMYGLTAAHPWYQTDTILRVTNLSNNKSLVIRVNDRMPKHPNRIIDLSYGTAIELDMVESGLTEVKLEILKWGDNKYKKSGSN